MKKLKEIYIVSIIAALFFAGCKKDKEPTPTSTTPAPAALTCKVDSQNFVAKTVVIRWVDEVGGVSKIGCEAADANGNKVTFVVETDTIGTYNIADTWGDALDFTYEPAGQSQFYGFGSQDTAIVTFTQIDNYDQNNMEISGTFQYSVRLGSDIKNITEGVFNNVKW